MDSSFNSKKKSKFVSGKMITFLLVFVFSFSILIAPLKPVHAQLVVSDVPKLIWDKAKDIFNNILKKAGSVAFNKTLSTALNKIAYDTANWIGSGGEGQKPLFITKDWGSYLEQIGDEAAGDFLENFSQAMADSKSQQATSEAQKQATNSCYNSYQPCVAGCPDTNSTECIKECASAQAACYKSASSIKVTTNNATLNICQPSSLSAKLKIGLGLVDSNRPQGPNCTASEMISNWESEVDEWGNVLDAVKNSDFNDPQFLSKFRNIFDPRSNDLGIYLTLQAGSSEQVSSKVDTSKLSLGANNGWLDVRNIADELQGTPEQPAEELAAARQARQDSIGKTTGDVFVDAANIFLNQLALSAFNNLMRNLGKNTSQGTVSSNVESDPNIKYGESKLKEITSKIIQPNYGVPFNYDILANLVVCPNAANPGPTDCVIDSNFMQAITDKKTIAEAINDGNLHGDWQITADTQEGSYSLRNLSILRKYRIISTGFEEALVKGNGRKMTLMDLVSCFKDDDGYEQFSEKFLRADREWCRGLVDPNWVLKAPLNYCKKSGVGAQITSTSVTPGRKGVNGEADTLSELNLVRAEEYCADEQTCIKEKKDGSCESYGYCNEEKRIWSFGTESCEPINNTCQAYTKTSTSQKAAYLENTLNFDNCSASSAGCKQYTTSGVFSATTGSVNWNDNSSIYLNKNVEGCSSADAGCTELLRVRSTWGANLVMNSDFSNDTIGNFSVVAKLNAWPISGNGSFKSTIVDASQSPLGSSGKALKIESTGAATGEKSVEVFSDYYNSLLPAEFEIIPGRSYTLSADVFLAAGAKTVLEVGEDRSVVRESATKNSWQRLSVTRQADSSFNNASFSIKAEGSNVLPLLYIKNIKFEMSDYSTGYSSYGASRTYQKLIPAYLESVCYVSSSTGNADYNLKPNAPAQCSDYVKRCNQNEVGCEMFSAVKGIVKVAAKTSDTDYCDEKCLGYDVYIAKATNFNSAKSENLIPANSQKCSAGALGCTEFTNLEKLSAGGESKEYYTSLKYCVKPSQATCHSFVSYETDSNGTQLVKYDLQVNADNGPTLISGSVSSCTAAIYNLPVNSPDFNPDCKEYISSSGQVFYRLSSKTITCSDSCRSYRMSEKNVDASLKEADCQGTDKFWDVINNNCISCLNNGVWDNVNKACLYQAIPNAGTTCSASQNACREYNGSAGANVRVAYSADFENGLGVWNSNCSGGVSIESVSSNRNGHSLLYNSNASNCLEVGSDRALSKNNSRPFIQEVIAGDGTAAQLTVASFVNTGRAYSIKFLAKSAYGSELTLYFYNKNTGEKSIFNNGEDLEIKEGNEWGLYQVNLDSLSHQVSSNEVLVISADSSFYLDSFILTEISDRYYLKQNTSQIPDVCYYDILDNYQGPEYNLGCAQYKDQSNGVHNLRQFSSFCSESSVGCEQMVSTKNYNSPGEGIWNDTNNNKICDAAEKDCVKVEADSMVYAVFNKSKQCNQADLGCSLMGQGQNYNNNLVFSDVFKRNNPNRYDTNICRAINLGCEEWKNSDSGGFSYFKDPGNNVCSYRNSQDGSVTEKDWYKIAVKRCDINSDNKIGGTEKEAAVCLKDTDCSSGKCIIDNNDYLCPTSSLKTIGYGGAGNQILVPSEDAGLCEAAESGCTEYIDPLSRFNADLVSSNLNSVKLQQNRLYIVSLKDLTKAGEIITFTNFVRPLLSDNTYGAAVKELMVSSSNKSILFNALGNTSASILYGANIELREAVVDYQLEQGVDKSSCKGVLKFDNGCILFNERSVSGASGLSSLANKYDAFSSSDGASPTVCTSSNLNACSANQLIKVRPDRICANWFDCITYVKDEKTNERVCYAVGKCDRLDDKGECSNFIDDTAGGSGHDLTGYSFFNKYSLGQMTEVGLNTEAHFDFEDSIPALSCKTASNGLPCSTVNIVKTSLVRGPDEAKNETSYPAHGKTYLKVPVSYIISPHSSGFSVKLQANKDYFINYLVNTEKSNSATKLVIRQKGGEVISGATYLDDAKNGWERKIKKLPRLTKDTDVVIELGAKDITVGGFVYFDDINIEPVLEVATNQYVARECRLYPTTDSLTCVNKNNNVIKDGLEGYCLEHDKNNSAVCLSWYPVDRINSAQSKASTQGYSGKYPLNYCTEVNGNFELVEKRTGAMFAYSGGAIWDRPELTGRVRDDNKEPSKDSDGSFINKREFLGGEKATSCYKAGITTTNCEGCFNEINSIQICGSVDYIALYDEVQNDKKGVTMLFYCVPKQDALLLKTEKTISFSKYVTGMDCIAKFNEGWAKYNGLHFKNFKYVVGNTDELADKTLMEDLSENKIENPVRVYNYERSSSDESGLEFISGSDQSNIFRVTCNNFSQVVDSMGNNQAWAARTGINSVWATNTPPFFYDLKENAYYANGTVTASNQGCSAEMGCVEGDFCSDILDCPGGSCQGEDGYCSGSGECQFQEFYDGCISCGGTWVSTSGTCKCDDSQCLTEITTSGHDLAAYGRNRDDVPFGSAAWPDDFNLLSSGPIYLQNQYSKKNNETVLAGRPYGCTGESCSKIGYCSLNPNIYCLYAWKGENYVNKKTCAEGGYGYCLPLWDAPLLTLSDDKDYESILKTIFLKSYNAYVYQGTGYQLDSKGMYDFSQGKVGGPEATSLSDRPKEEYGTLDGKIFYLLPKISNVKFDNASPGTVIGKGLHVLSFNSTIDKEQLPLKFISINWGDGAEQVVSWQDSKPLISNPHLFYHYYKNSLTNALITVKIWDNWGYYDTVTTR